MHTEHRRQVLGPKRQQQVAEASEADKKQYQQVGARGLGLIHGLMIAAVRGRLTGSRESSGADGFVCQPRQPRPRGRRKS